VVFGPTHLRFAVWLFLLIEPIYNITMSYSTGSSNVVTFIFFVDVKGKSRVNRSALTLAPLTVQFKLLYLALINVI
jgi:hypothetical protein